MARFDFLHFPISQNTHAPSLQHLVLNQLVKVLSEWISAQNANVQRRLLVRKSGFRPFREFCEVDKEPGFGLPVLRQFARFRSGNNRKRDKNRQNHLGNSSISPSLNILTEACPLPLPKGRLSFF